MPQILHSRSFEESVSSVSRKLHRWLIGPQTALPNFDDVEDTVFLKNRDLTIVYANKAYMGLFSAGQIPIGRQGAAFLSKSIAKVSLRTDRLLLDGIDKLEFEHVGLSSDGRTFSFKTHKSLIASKDSVIAILGVTRPVSLDEEDTLDDYIEAKFMSYKELTRDDQLICKLYADGEATKEIAATLDLSPKAIENHRKKILTELGLDRPIEIVKLLVRFHERGLINSI